MAEVLGVQARCPNLNEVINIPKEDVKRLVRKDAISPPKVTFKCLCGEIHTMNNVAVITA